MIAEAQLWQRGRAGAWILIPGLLRYAYVLALAIVPATAGHVRSSPFARRAFVALLVGLIAALLSDGAVATALAADRHGRGHVLVRALVSLVVRRAPRLARLALSLTRPPAER